MASITIEDPKTGDTLGRSFTASGKFTQDFKKDAPDTRPNTRVDIKCWVENRGGDKFSADSISSDEIEQTWQAEFIDVPVDTPYVLHASITVAGVETEGTPVSKLTVRSSDGGRLQAPSTESGDAARTDGKGHGAPSSAKPLATADAKPAPKRLRIHVLRSKVLAPEFLLLARRVSAYYMIGGKPVTRVFEGEVSHLEGGFDVKMDLRRVNHVNKPGTIKYTVELADGGALKFSDSNLLVVED